MNADKIEKIFVRLSQLDAVVKSVVELEGRDCTSYGWNSLDIVASLIMVADREAQEIFKIAEGDYCGADLYSVTAQTRALADHDLRINDKESISRMYSLALIAERLISEARAKVGKYAMKMAV